MSRRAVSAPYPFRHSLDLEAPPSCALCGVSVGVSVLSSKSPKAPRRERAGSNECSVVGLCRKEIFDAGPLANGGDHLLDERIHFLALPGVETEVVGDDGVVVEPEHVLQIVHPQLAERDVFTSLVDAARARHRASTGSRRRKIEPVAIGAHPIVTAAGSRQNSAIS
jgi:hypothetical protein